MIGTDDETFLNRMTQLQQLTKSVTDQRNLDNDLALAANIAALAKESDSGGLIKLCHEQGVEVNLRIVQHDAHGFQSPSDDAKARESTLDVASELAALLFRERLLPPANRARHADALATILTNRYPCFVQDAAPVMPPANELVDGEGQEDVFFAPVNSKFRAQGCYTNLEIRKAEIRLLALHPGRDDEEIQCTLLDPISLKDDSHRKYDTMSYAAGDVNKVTKIYVNNIEFEIYQSLGRALRRMRHRTYAIHIWIDQICINQHNLAEKAWQVEMMRDIYSKARKTWVFLDVDCDGAASTDLKTLLHLIHRRMYEDFISNDREEPTPSAITSVDMLDNAYVMKAVVGVTNAERRVSQWLTNLLLQEENFHALQTLISVWSAPWWHRSWVYQEVVVSSEIELLLANSEINWHTFQHCSLAIKGAAASCIANVTYAKDVRSKMLEHPEVTWDLIFKLEQGQPAISHLSMLRWVYMTSGEVDIRLLLNTWRRLESTDQRDQIFAALGLAKSAYRILPNYATENTIAEVLMQVVRRSIYVDGSLDIILDGVSPDRHQEWKLPSWVPDFTVSTDHKFGMLTIPRIDNEDLQRNFPAITNQQWKAMKESPADFQFVDPRTPPFASSLSSIPFSASSRVLRIKLVRRWSLQRHEIGMIGSRTKDHNEVKYNWLSFIANKENEYNASTGDLPQCAPYPPVKGEWLSLAYQMTVHLCPDRDMLIHVYGDSNQNMDHPSVRQDQLEAIENRNRMQARLEETQRTGRWRFFCTDSTVMGLVPAETEPGDCICFAAGISTPFVIRDYRGGKADIEGGNESGFHDEQKTRTIDNEYMVDTGFFKCTIVGRAYVHGYMFGLAADELQQGKTLSEWVEIY